MTISYGSDSAVISLRSSTLTCSVCNIEPLPRPVLRRRPRPRGIGRGRSRPSAPVIRPGGAEAFAEWVVARVEPVRNRDLTAGAGAEVPPQTVAVRLRRSRRDAQAFRDLLVRAAGGEELHDLALSIGDRFRARGGEHLHEPRRYWRPERRPIVLRA